MPRSFPAPRPSKGKSPGNEVGQSVKNVKTRLVNHNFEKAPKIVKNVNPTACYFRVLEVEFEMSKS